MMRSFGLSRLALVAAAALAGCAAPTADGPGGSPAQASAHSGAQRCFRAGDVSGWRPGDADTVYVRVAVNRIYQMQLMSPCSDINWSETIGIEARGSSMICSGIDATIVAPSTIGPRRCPVTSIRELTPAEVAALPARSRP